jgi:hypothetical protein
MARFVIFQYDLASKTCRDLGEHDAPTAYDACMKAATGDVVPGVWPSRNPVGEYAAYPVEGSGAFGLQLNVEVLKLDGKPIGRDISEHPQAKEAN